jgi:hypothetical protein
MFVIAMRNAVRVADALANLHHYCIKLGGVQTHQKASARRESNESH